MGKELTGFFQEAFDRGFVQDFSAPIGEMNDLFNTPIVGYVGFDCTADSLHVGNLTSLMLLRLFQKHGHKAIVLIGTSTTKIGDPSGKDEARVMLTEEQITHNALGIHSAISRFLEDGSVEHNSDWLEDESGYEPYNIGIIPFLTEVGQHFSINRMLARDSVKRRLENGGLSYLEFSYMVLQAYDFVQLYGRSNCVLQMGGSDQWGNIVAGIDLGRRMKGIELFGLTTPLITTANGEKMGKTAKGAVWLNEDKLSPYEYWQFWRNTDDKDVGRFLRLFTDLSLEGIAQIEKRFPDAINSAKIILATEATALCHGREAANAAMATAQRVFVQGGSDGLPIVEVVLAPGEKTRLADVFVRTGLVNSLGQARRLAKEGGAYLSDEAIAEDRMMVFVGFPPGTEIKLSAGKKHHVVVQFLSFHVR